MGKQFGRYARTVMRGTLHLIAQLPKFIRQSKKLLKPQFVIRVIGSHLSFSLLSGQVNAG